jgi:hypothetical protein
LIVTVFELILSPKEAESCPKSGLSEPVDTGRALPVKMRFIISL